MDRGAEQHGALLPEVTHLVRVRVRVRVRVGGGLRVRVGDGLKGRGRLG